MSRVSRVTGRSGQLAAEGGHDELGAGLGVGLLDELVEHGNGSSVEPDLNRHRGLSRPRVVASLGNNPPQAEVFLGLQQGR